MAPVAAVNHGTQLRPDLEQQAEVQVQEEPQEEEEQVEKKIPRSRIFGFWWGSGIWNWLVASFFSVGKMDRTTKKPKE